MSSKISLAFFFGDAYIDFVRSERIGKFQNLVLDMSQRGLPILVAQSLLVGIFILTWPELLP